jgi:thiol-disulfide isomerase/thioredoxin
MSAPELFSKLSLEEARAAAGDKWLLIDFTASWCGPCKHMDETTWVSPDVVAWAKQNAIALQIDVDNDPAAKDFDIRAMPTIVAMRKDAEVDRIIGARSPKQLLEWLAGLEHGETDLDRVSKGAGDDPMQRFQLAQTLLMRGAYDRAMEQAIWLWQNGVQADPAFVGARHSFVVALMRQAADASSHARGKLAVLRDSAERGSHDWRSLNEALRDSQKTLGWFDELKASGKPLPDEPSLKALLRAHNRWKDVGELSRAPLDELALHFAHRDELDGPAAAQVPAEMLGMLREQLKVMVRAEAANLVRALRAAGRVEDAHAVAAEARRRDPSGEMSLALSEVE